MTNTSSEQAVAIRLLLIAWATAAAIAIVAGTQMSQFSLQPMPAIGGHGMPSQTAAASLMARSAP